MGSFSEGFDYFQKNAGGSIGSFLGEKAGSDIVDQVNLADEVNKEIDNFIEHLNAFRVNKSDVDKLSGRVAEAWHADTYNINAAKVKVANRVYFDSKEHGFASPDLFSDLGGQASLKYYKDAKATVKAQGLTYQEAAHKSSVAAQRLIDGSANGRDLIYGDMTRIGPSDQIDEIKQLMREKVAIEKAKRTDQAQRYEKIGRLSRATYEEAGVESKPLTREGSKELTRDIKDNPEGINADDLEKYGIYKEYVEYSQIIGEALKAGLTSATITAVLKASPDIYKALDYYVKAGAVDKKMFVDAGKDFLSGGAEGFARGAVSAAIVSCCKSGLLGEAAKDINSGIVGMATVIAIDSMKNSLKVVNGQMTRGDMAEELIKEMYVSTCSYIAGTVSQMAIDVPVFGYMIGSFIGSVIGSFSYNVGQKVVVSLCSDSGITMFGLVDQDYHLSDDLLNEIGVEVFEYEDMNIDEFEYEDMQIDCFDIDQFELETIGISFIRRGVIGVSRVGYIE